ncbi:hypothetical protein L7F22_008920 [Adiantum nelumboides]|nr:hypothetical protein [Adiantum nelumboides]
MIREYDTDLDFKDLMLATAPGKKEEPYNVQDGYLLYGNRLCVTQALSEKAVYGSHAPHYAGHSGIQATQKEVETYFYWPTMKANIQDYVAKCIVCQKTKYDRGKQLGLLQPLPIPDSPWESISMDFIFGLPRSIHENMGKNKMEDYPQLTKFCYIVEELHEEYGLRLQGLLPKDITKDILPEEQWLTAFKFKHQKGAKIYVSHVHPRYIDDCRLLFHTMYQAPPSCGEITAKFSQGYAFERCHAATKDLVGHTVAWAHFGENVIKMCDTRTRGWSRRSRLGERQIVSLRVPVTAGKSLAFHSLAASYAQRLRPLVFQVDEEDVKLPYQEVQTTKTESLKNGGPGLEKVVVMDVEDQAMDSVGMNAVDSTTIDVDLLPKEQTKFARASTIDINMLHDDSPKIEKNCEIEGVLLDAAEAMAEVDALKKKLEGFFDERKKERAVDNGMNGAA